MVTPLKWGSQVGVGRYNEKIADPPFALFVARNH